MNLFVVSFLLFYTTSNLYLGYRFVSVFKLNGWLVGFVWLCVAVCPLFLRREADFLPADLSDLLYFIGAYWIVFMYYGLIITVFCDLFAWLQRGLGLNILNISARTVGCLVLAALAAISVYGSYNAQNTRIVEYSIKIDKPAAVGNMRIAMLSDLHLGRINGARLVDKAVNLVNGLEADILFILGDTVDMDIDSVFRKQPLDGLKNLKTRYGAYAVLGNHEYIGRRAGEVVEYLNSRNINVLVDEAIRLPNNVLIVGRNDYSRRKINGKALRDLLTGVDSQPVIVLDHQPTRIEEAEQAGVDLLLCGHTHRGQLAPNNLVTGYLFSIDHGWKKINRLNVVVTSGFGTWGPPVRIGGRQEIILLDIQFAE